MKQLAHLVFLLGAAADSAAHVWLERNSDTQNNLSFEVFVSRALGDASYERGWLGFELDKIHQLSC